MYKSFEPACSELEKSSAKVPALIDILENLTKLHLACLHWKSEIEKKKNMTRLKMKLIYNCPRASATSFHLQKNILCKTGFTENINVPASSFWHARKMEMP